MEDLKIISVKVLKIAYVVQNKKHGIEMHPLE